MPEHGETGELSVYDRQNRNVHVRCTSRKRWCEHCQQWIGGTGIVSMVVGSVGCIRCGTPWVKTETKQTDECPF